MAKAVMDFGTARCIHVEPVDKYAEMAWSKWRKQYIGRTGKLLLYASEKKYPGFLFLCFTGTQYTVPFRDGVIEDDWYLRTSYGKGRLDKEIFTFCTTNSRYVFQLDKENAARVREILAESV